MFKKQLYTNNEKLLVEMLRTYLILKFNGMEFLDIKAAKSHLTS